VGLSGVAIGQFYGTLILLGLGWNFGFIGATSLLATAYSRPSGAGAGDERRDRHGLRDGGVHLPRAG
jgi:hypothetical protein